MNKTHIAYTGKKVFIGIDVHKRTYAVSCVCEGEVVKSCTMEARPEALVGFIQKYFDGAIVKSAYEAGFSAFVLHRYLISKGFDNIVVHAASIEIAARDVVKTDKRDSKKIALQLEAGRLRSIYIPTVEQEARRVITRTREQLIGARRRLMNQIRMKFHQFGLLEFDDRGVLSNVKVLRALEKNKYPEMKAVTESLLIMWKTTNQQIREFQKLILKQGESDPLEPRYRSMPHFGAITARTLSNELGDLQQFANEEALFSFTGLTPQEFSSGDHRRLGHISRHGSSRLREVLVEAAWRAIKADPALFHDFERIAARAGNSRAIVAIARKLIGRARALFRKKEYYAYEIELKKAT